MNLFYVNAQTCKYVYLYGGPDAIDWIRTENPEQAL